MSPISSPRLPSPIGTFRSPSASLIIVWVIRISGPRSVSISMRPPMIASTVPTIIADSDIVAERWLISLPRSCAVLTNCSSV
ncbi:hypothetical protein ACVIRO_006328 [Rhizobium ruizarguesonis]